MEDLKAIVCKAVEEADCECWWVEFSRGKRRAHLRVFIDREDGVTLDDCARVSRRLSAALDVENVIRQAYTLEVSSPGIERPLCAPAHYRRFVGRRAQLRCYEPIDGRRRLAGVIKTAADDHVGLIVGDEEINIPIGNIRRGKLLAEDGGERTDDTKVAERP